MTGIDVDGKFRFEGDRVFFILSNIDGPESQLDLSAITSMDQFRKLLDAICKIGFEIARMSVTPKAAEAPAENAGGPFEEAEQRYQAALKRAEGDIKSASDDALKAMQRAGESG